MEPTPVSSKENSQGSATSGSILGNSKRWLPCFFHHRITRDRLFVDTVQTQNRDLLTAFLQDNDYSGPSWQVEQAQRFCTESPEVPDAKIRTDNRISSLHSDPTESRWMTSVEYCQTLPVKNLVALSSDCDIHRRLTFVPNLTSNIIKALMETSTWFESQTLRSAICQYIVREPSIRVHIPMSGFPIFRLSMHLPYLILTPSLDKETTDGQGTKLWDDISFLPLTIDSGSHTTKYSVYESMTSIVISGAHNYNWYGYAFGTPGAEGVRTQEEDDDSDASDNDDEGSEPEFLEEEEEDFAMGRPNPETHPNSVIMDPRVYFLCAFQVRMDVVSLASEYCVRHLELGFKLRRIREKKKKKADSVTTSAEDMELRQSLEEITNIKELFQLLREFFSKINMVWECFRGKGGDIGYFQDLDDMNAKSALHKIEECFEKMKNLELTLERLQHTCDQHAENLALRLSHQMIRKMAISHEHNLEISESATESANKSQRAAEDTGRATRVNVQLLMVTTAVVIALQYFCAERDLFAFERSAQAFWISICVLVPALLLLTFALHALDEFKEVLTKRLYRNLTVAAAPMVQRVASISSGDKTTQVRHRNYGCLRLRNRTIGVLGTKNMIEAYSRIKSAEVKGKPVSKLSVNFADTVYRRAAVYRWALAVKAKLDSHPSQSIRGA
ncbi:hypothetical protein OPT61_g4232 [Boeremia exigua]|uniref:Uncharacterized protein n=1 Tax=Boeremia exigua TaxID=749465 RepID=A0ACC2IEV3_9PLEO|nr:hypothetical protein OPT61_g4232 [Boeremia exigua]